MKPLQLSEQETSTLRSLIWEKLDSGVDEGNNGVLDELDAKLSELELEYLDEQENN